eukprot:3835538-Alexandrium_andersonii.AAC.1
MNGGRISAGRGPGVVRDGGRANRWRDAAPAWPAATRAHRGQLPRAAAILSCLAAEGSRQPARKTAKGGRGGAQPNGAGGAKRCVGS